MAQKVSLEPSPYIMTVASAGEPVPINMLIKAALVLSGTPDQEIAPLTEKINLLLRELSAEIQADWEPYRIGEYILEFLHQRVFTLYDEYQTRVDIALETGYFNCVSSAVLYLIFARSLGLPVQGVSTLDHAFCTVVLQGEIVDIETTTLHGFDPGKKKEFVDDFGNITGYSYVPPSDYSRRQTINEKKLLSLILQNRISLLERRRMFAEAIQLSVDRYVFSPDAETDGHMIRAFLNYAALLNERHNYDDAIDFLSLAVENYGWRADYKKIFGILGYNIVVDLIQREQYSEALQRVEDYAIKEWIDVSARNQLGGQIAERVLARDLETLSTQDGIRLVGDLYEKGLLIHERFLEYSVMLYVSHAEELAENEDFLGAELRIRAAIDTLGPDSRLIKARNVYLHNYAVGIHNSFASLFNSQDYAAAMELVQGALAHYPENTILQGDLTSVKRVISSLTEQKN